MPSDLQARIAGRFEQLSPKQRQIARVIADNETLAVYASASELGKVAGADAATVVRFAQALGFSGYTDLQETVRATLPERLTFVQRVEQQMTAPLDLAQLPARVFANDIQNLEQTATRLQPETIEAVVQAILRADRVVVVGMGFSAATAVFLGHGLTSIGIRTTVLTEAGPTLTIGLANLRPSDLLVAVSVWRYLRATTDAVAEASARGVATVALTDSQVSPTARIADQTLVAATQGAAHSLSPVGLLAIVNLLLAEVGASEPERTLASLREIDRLYRERQMVDGTERGE